MHQSGYPVVRGIELVPTSRLPDRLRTIFSFTFFNAIQSKCFPSVYQSNDNFVLSAPTGAGKTAVLELAICRLLSDNAISGNRFKVIYQAPTKGLCNERFRDWKEKFKYFGLRAMELTGDTENTQLRNMQSAHIIITTPEKWDSFTRRWKDHSKFMELIRLFLIDEVHLLKEDRGACLEAIVSRMKSIGSYIRFIAASATVPNSGDVARWLCRSRAYGKQPALCETFDDTFRPVALSKQVKGYSGGGMSDAQFDALCSKKLPQVIEEYGDGKSVLIFCSTRMATESTARILVQWSSASSDAKHPWPLQKCDTVFQDSGLKACVKAGVAYHHAGLDMKDRHAVENAYLSRKIGVICCTSTLAVGMNLPCYLVIVKTTVSYQDHAFKTLSDLEITQMLGRAGRPQFGNSAVAVIMTRQENLAHYQDMISNKDALESRLHLNLTEHINAEISNGTIVDLNSAKQWLESTFLYVRLSINPLHYAGKDGTLPTDPHQWTNSVCRATLQDLCNNDIIILEEDKVQNTPYGHAMARYYVHFETMKALLSLPPAPRQSEILAALSMSTEFSSIRFKSNEKNVLQEINDFPEIRYKIPHDPSLTVHKISLLMQAAMGGLDLQHDGRVKSHQKQLSSDQTLIFQHAGRLVRCMLDCLICRGQADTVLRALEFLRSISAKAWDDSPVQLMQLEGIGPASVRKLASKGIKSLEDLQATGAQHIDMFMSRNPPFGANLLKKLQTFPVLRVSLKAIDTPKSNAQAGVTLRVNCEVAFLNEGSQTTLARSQIPITILIASSDGDIAQFCRIEASKLLRGQNIVTDVTIRSMETLVTCNAACELIAGTSKNASLKPTVPAYLFASSAEHAKDNRIAMSPSAHNARKKNSAKAYQVNDIDDEVADADLDQILPQPRDDFDDIDEVMVPTNPKVQVAANTSRPRSNPNNAEGDENLYGYPQILKIRKDGKWECNHKCKDKTSCRHLCCKEGLSKQPRPPKQSKIGDPIHPNVSSMKSWSKESNTKSDTLSVGKDPYVQETPRRTSGELNERRSPETSTSYSDVESLFDDPDTLETAICIPKALRIQPEKGRSLFLNDTSSPEKRTVECIDLSQMDEASLPRKKSRIYDQAVDDSASKQAKCHDDDEDEDLNRLESLSFGSYDVDDIEGLDTEGLLATAEGKNEDNPLSNLLHEEEGSPDDLETSPMLSRGCQKGPHDGSRLSPPTESQIDGSIPKAWHAFPELYHMFGQYVDLID